jgi:hypothetical protein
MQKSSVYNFCFLLVILLIFIASCAKAPQVPEIKPPIQVYAEETFYSALESKESVEAEGGEVLGGRFVPGKEGNGFMSEKKTHVIHFPFEDRLVNLDEGTIEFWVKLSCDIDKLTDVTGKNEICMFWSSNADGTGTINLSFGGGIPNVPIAHMGIREAKGEWNFATSEDLDWREGEIHHMAGTWGPDGINLYLDGELAATNNFTGGPLNPIERFSINNNGSGWVVDEIRIFDHQRSYMKTITSSP